VETQRKPMRTMFTVYVLFITAGLAVYITVGLTHH
jgi:hypothetical protein